MDCLGSDAGKWRDKLKIEQLMADEGAGLVQNHLVEDFLHEAVVAATVCSESVRDDP